MGVYIEGMEMPKNCWRCCLSQLYEKPRDMLVCKVTHEEVLRYKIDSNCPLVPVPDHGRLIDADEFLRRAIGTKCFRGDYALMLEELVGESTTIIPAEEGE